MCMSDSSRDNDSNGSRKSLRNRLQSMQSSDRTEARKGQHLSDITKNIGNTLQSIFSSKSDSSVYSKGVRELDDFGYEKYNLEDDGGEIFISRVPEKAFFNDGEPVIVRATGGNFVGSSDNTAACFDVGEAEAKAEDMRNLFSNVPRGTTVETEYHATVGEVTADGTVRPKPIDPSFLGRMKPVSNERRPVPDMEIAEEVSEAPQVEPARFITIDDEGTVEVPDVAEEPDVPEITINEVSEEAHEAPVEEPDHSFLAKVTRSPRTDFIIDPEEPEAEVPVADDVEESSDDDYDWIFADEDQDEIEEVPVEEPVTGLMEVQVDPMVEEVQTETPIEASVEVSEAEIEEVPAEDVEVPTEPMVEEVQTEVPVEEPVVAFREEPEETVVAEVPVEVTEEMPIEASATEVPAEEPAEAPVEEPVAVMSLPGTVEVAPLEPIEGIEMEGSAPSSESAVSDSVVEAPALHEAAVTDVDAESVSKFVGLDEDGEALPRLSDPVVRRPRTVRFRFSNGVLQNVGPEKVEPKEELRDPLA